MCALPLFVFALARADCGVGDGPVIVKVYIEDGSYRSVRVRAAMVVRQIAEVVLAKVGLGGELSTHAITVQHPQGTREVGFDESARGLMDPAIEAIYIHRRVLPTSSTVSSVPPLEQHGTSVARRHYTPPVDEDPMYDQIPDFVTTAASDDRMYDERTM